MSEQMKLATGGMVTRPLRVGDVFYSQFERRWFVVTLSGSRPATPGEIAKKRGRRASLVTR